MNYTREEYNLISGAMADASTYLDAAYASLSLFQEQYFEGMNDYKHLASELEYRPEVVASQIFCIMHSLYEAKIELDVFVNHKSPQLRARINNAAEMHQIIAEHNRPTEQ